MDFEKENINVVIVPETILQAIRSSSNLDVEFADSVSSASTQQKDDLPSIQDEVNLQNLSNKSIWFMLPNENVEISSQSTLLGSSESENCFAGTSNTYSMLECQNLNQHSCVSTYNCNTSELLLHQESVYSCAPNIESSFSFSCENPVTTHTRSFTNDISVKHCSVATLQSTFVPTSHKEANSFQDCGNSEASFSYQNEKNAGLVNISSINANPPLISHQEVVKNSVLTADKGTYIDGNVKPLHICDVKNCNKAFKSLLEFRKHKTTVHEKEKPYKCTYDDCLWSFSTPYKLRRHLESHYKRKPYSCTYPGCSAVFSNDYNQRAHLKLHYIVKPSRICSLCGEKTASKKSLAAHMRDVHKQAPEFVCNLCKRNFCSLAALVVHKKSHNPPIEHTCPVCQKKFQKRYYLKIHLYTHTQEKPFKCKLCGCGFASSSRLNRHMWVHRNDRKFSCTEKDCGMKFYRLTRLFAHLRKKHKLEPCYDNDILQMYVNKESTNGEIASFFECEACGLKCLSSHGLNRHKQKCQEHQYMINVSAKGKFKNAESSIIESELEDETIDDDDPVEVEQGENIIVEINGFPPKIPNEGDIFSHKKETTNHENNETLSKTNIDQSVTNGDLIVDFENDWNPTLITSSSVSGKQLPYYSNQYNAANTQVSFVPFMTDMNVLDDPSTKRFLQFNDLSVCISSAQDESNAADKLDDNDVLKQYVVSTHANTKVVCPEKSQSLLEDKVDLNRVGDRTSNQFSGSTINIDDIH